MYYFTCIDVYSGVYQSQVIDVVKTVSKLCNKELKIIAFIPVTNYFLERKKIKKNHSKSIVFPMFMGVTGWKYTKIFLLFFNKNKPIICRGPIATKLALHRFANVIYDGRSAVKAEVEEYDVVNGNKTLGKEFIEAERESVLKSNFRIAVSHKLVNYWQTEIGYNSKEHIVIPCTLSSWLVENKLSFKSDKVKVVYSGGTGPWQSFSKVVILLDDVMSRQENIEVLFLTKANTEIDQLIKKYPNRCSRKWVDHNEVLNELSKCDYGILLRDNRVTNKVASPVKFAEYLSAGLDVLISENIGDFTDFVVENKCGLVVGDHIPFLNKVTDLERAKNIRNCQKYFSKESPLINTLFTKLIQKFNM
jgi:hypothetical protein